jgi:hypothetical protein
MITDLTPMERAIIQLVANHNWPGFMVNELEVTRRECTGVGRYSHFVDRAGQSLTDGLYGSETRFIEMDGVPKGLFFTVAVENERISFLEIVACGTDVWDGVERAWRIV